ncbi:MAG TPA: DUF6441 family protein [Candidatus Saccharimonadales bacterium]|nr:DUF6441 family protein [Candidatus Saccharimonadales bacterium]
MKVDITLVKPQDFGKMMEDNHTSVKKASTAAFREGGDNIKKAARANIASGGFSSRWQNAMRVNVYPKTGDSGSPKILAYHKIKYAGQFEDPGPVRGHPLLWLPIEQNLPGGKHWSPSLFTRMIGPLRGGRHGSRPILFGQVSVGGGGKKVLRLTRKGARAKPAQKAWLPVFIGVSSVNNSKRLDITSVVEAEAGDLAHIFSTKWEEQS